MITLDILLIVALAGGVLALVDGIIRVRGRGTAVVAVIEIVVAALFIVSFFIQVPFGSLILAIATLVVLVLQLVLSGRVRRGAIPVTVIALILIAAWIVLAQRWIIIPGIN